MVNLIRPLYRLERELRQGAPPPEEIHKRRQAESAELVAKIFSAPEDRLKNTQNPPINALRRAIDYAMERREMLESWLYDPNIPIDNNAAERAVRPVTIGRKNCLFIGAPEAGQYEPIHYKNDGGSKVDSLAWLFDRLSSTTEETIETSPPLPFLSRKSRLSSKPFERLRTRPQVECLQIALCLTSVTVLPYD